MSMPGNFMSKEATLRVLRRILAVGAGIYLLTAGTMGGGALYFGKKATVAQQEAKADEAEAFEAKKLVKRGRSSPDVGAVQGMDGVAEFQAATVQSAARHNCQLGQFVASQEIAPFDSRFGAKAPAGQWGQVDVQLELQGRTLDVARVLRSWAEGSIPFEFNSVDLSRASASSTGRALVSAKVSLRVIVSMEKKA